MKVPEHEHPLELIDLQQEEDEEEEEEEDGGGGDLTTEEIVRFRCDRCRQEISMYHRYYYKCIIGSCDYTLHTFCAELPERLVHTSHPHSLTLIDGTQTRYWRCNVCRHSYKSYEMRYKCSSCYFLLDINCAVEVRKNIIHHPCHPHPLMSAIRKPISCECSACGKGREGIFYQCTICDFFTIHKDCAYLPKKLLIQKTTRDAFYHTHPLTISYSFSMEDQRAKHFPRCRVCGFNFINTEYLWTYKCDKCLYYAHVECATRAPYAGFGKTIKNFEDADHPHLLHLPFHDVTCSLPKHLLFEESRSRVEEVSLNHNLHQHPLILVETQTSSKKINSWSLMCHDPMKKVQLLCNGCLRPITSTMPFFKCADEEDESCDFALHEWCTRLPEIIENHPGHSKHTLVLKSNNLEMFFGVFHCVVCGLPCNGFAYCCVDCEYYVDVTCGLIPTIITHTAHPNHLLSITHDRTLFKHYSCSMCDQFVYDPYSHPFKQEPLAFRCKECYALIHSECALLIPEKISHKYDKHSMHLSYLPIENHKSEYFCEICEEDLNPHESFYHCRDCVQSIHSACAPSILQSETETYSRDSYRFQRAIHDFMNIKFGGIHNTDGHQHHLSFSQGTVLDGRCSICSDDLRYKMIFKCLECKFAIDYSCCKNLKRIESF